jgi:hypothetical protein
MTADEARRARIAAMLCEHDALRMPIVGCSMQPSLGEPMILQIGPAAGARTGDVLIFRSGDTHVAHRIIGETPGTYHTSGDAQPHVVEAVRAQQVVGRVVAVWSDGSPTATRVDGRMHRLRGWYYARFHAVRRAVRIVRMRADDLLVRLQPHRRRRTMQGIVDALAAAARNDAVRLARALDFDALRFRAVDRRHRTGAMLGEAARRLGVVDALPNGIADSLRRARLSAALEATRMQRAVETTIAILREAGIPFALLKGAARIYAGSPEAACHPSDDVDVLLRRDDVERAVAAFVERGWYHRDDAARIERFRRSHHHAASLYPPTGGYPVELHHALARPGTLSTATDWDALEPFVVTQKGSAGTVLVLDAAGAALHLAIHAIGLSRLRDVALLAALLPRLTFAERAALRNAIAAERHDPIRLAAGVALAARIAGVSWPHDPAVDAYIEWALRREDLPERLRTRCGAIEARAAWPHAAGMAWRALVPWWSREAQLLALPLRLPARCASNLAAFAYAALMRKRDHTAI